MGILYMAEIMRSYIFLGMLAFEVYCFHRGYDMEYNSLGDFLVAHKRLSQEQSDLLRREAQEQQSSFDEYLIKQNILTAQELAQAYAQWYRLPLLMAITEHMVSPEVVAKVPLRFLREQVVIPVYVSEADKTLLLVMDRPYHFAPLDELRMVLGQDLMPAIATRALIIDAINRYYPLEGEKQMIAELAQDEEIAPAVDFGEIGEEDILGMASEAPIIKLVNHILYQAVKQDASDIHIEPFEREIQVRYRIDGALRMGMIPPKRAQSAIISRIKIMAHLNIAEKRKPQGGRIQLKIANKAIDVRVSVLPVVYGERIVMRLLDKSKTVANLEDLGLSSRDYQVLAASIEQPNGIILMTGPTGSGKTSTLYAILSRLNQPGVNIITVEDPVEYQMQGIGQVQVRDKIGLTFATVLREILRQDPDIVMIGETRDSETAQIAIQAALTGHLVLTTLHTNSAAAAVTRLIDMGIEPFLIASTMISVIAQRLVRRLCDACKRPYMPETSAYALLGITPDQAQHITFFQAVGCAACLNSGYRGRLAIFEIMRMSHDIARLVIERVDTRLIQQQASREGMTLLVHDGLAKIKQGLTTIEEVLSEATFRESEE